MPKYIYLHMPENSYFDGQVVKKSNQPKKYVETVLFTRYFQAVFIKTDQTLDVDLNRDKDTKHTKWREATLYVFSHIRQRAAGKNNFYLINPDTHRAESRRF